MIFLFVLPRKNCFKILAHGEGFVLRCLVFLVSFSPDHPYSYLQSSSDFATRQFALASFAYPDIPSVVCKVREQTKLHFAPLLALPASLFWPRFRHLDKKN